MTNQSHNFNNLSGGRETPKQTAEKPHAPFSLRLTFMKMLDLPLCEDSTKLVSGLLEKKGSIA